MSDGVGSPGSALEDHLAVTDPTEVRSAVRRAVARLRGQLAAIRDELPPKSTGSVRPPGEQESIGGTSRGPGAPTPTAPDRDG
ncbi:hypothetical protein [Saccharothrix hoggarensis]|uniref:Uncharacterized protein n=1 Tax=Saccharothrix hoggarensis TaxID=913853 RepID=A0ABW3QME7_9PSEU